MFLVESVWLDLTYLMFLMYFSLILLPFIKMDIVSVFLNKDLHDPFVQVSLLLLLLSLLFYTDDVLISLLLNFFSRLRSSVPAKMNVFFSLLKLAQLFFISCVFLPFLFTLQCTG